MGDMSWFRSLASCALGTSYDDLQNAPISNIEGDGVIVGQLTTGVYSISGTWKLTEDDRERQTPDDDLFYILNGENGTRVTWVSSVGMQTIYVPKGASITDVVVEGPPDYLELVQKNQKQPDWNQNDDTQPDYVKNRPFYTGAPVETVLVEESTHDFFDRNGLYGADLPPIFEATLGETYKVSWDGTVYECTCAAVDGVPLLLIGNLSIIYPGSDTGEPFIVGVSNGQGILIGTRDTSDHHTFSISGFTREVVKLDEKYIPSTIQRVGDDLILSSSTADSTKKFRITVDDSGLVQFVDKDTGSVYGTMAPAVTAEDDGKFLRVTDGQWAAVAITNAEEVSF